MSKKILFAIAVASLLLGGSRVFSSTPSCTPSRADILEGQTSQRREVGDSAPSCTPSRVDILKAERSR